MEKNREWWLLVRGDGDAIGAAKSEAQAEMRMDNYLQRFPKETYKRQGNAWISEFEVIKLVHVKEKIDDEKTQV